MKFKPTDKLGGLTVELEPQESQLPPIPAAEPGGVLPVFRLKKILVPVDFSDCSKKALAYAIPFAKQFNAELILIHVIRLYPPISEMGPVEVESEEDARHELESVKIKVGAGIRSTTVLRRGEAYAEIVDAASEFDADLIILSTHGRCGLARVVKGSTAEQVVRHAHCPVLVVREREHEFLTPEVSDSDEN